MSCGLLGLLLVVRAYVHVHVLVNGSAKAILGQHATNGMLHKLPDISPAIMSAMGFGAPAPAPCASKFMAARAAKTSAIAIEACWRG